MLETSKITPVNREHPLAVQIRRQITKALSDFNMIKEGDRLLICVSGGKDSSILTILMDEIRKRAPMNFTFEALLLDQKQPGFSAEKFKSWMAIENIKLHTHERDTYSIVTDKIKDGVFCSLCSKLRRAILYDFAFDHHFTKMALGHHRDDVIETSMLNLFYTGQLSTMPAKLRSDDGRNVIVRPLIYVPEKELMELAEIWNFPIIPCNLCGSQEGLKRKRMKRLISDLEKEIPHLGASYMTALENVKPSHLLDQKLFNFKDI
ncbi:MAG: tRNA 2-thiocytidine(32) synthetase TtcA [Bdellovibrionales bacterium RIFCSPHIGHO2_01_FULL_40_29]|nr:MAG: tRNA 2-thiocytidine(32) synthetase TtcA [Bdellovibrionales bacterium RIFCSPHIGHO2_01_FULL_40_29]OFZ32961.1 MAG: tRNA 2-thiocytidine(32) synthetase TtcA [Bdellovibrionales bacterium RIFCSPHIGHO2_02_FULL_40_15]